MSPGCGASEDSQAAVLTRFVQQGGKVLFVGECGTLTWEGLKRAENAFAGLLPAPEGDRVAFKQVGKGRTALIPGALDEKIESAQRLQATLFELLGHTPSCVRPDQSPLLLTNLTRNSNNSRFWMHLLNYDVDYEKSDAEKPIHSLKSVQVLVPLPDGLRAKSVQLYRPGRAEVTLTPEPVREGCFVTLPTMDIYALVAVATERGERREKGLFDARHRGRGDSHGRRRLQAATLHESPGHPSQNIADRWECRNPRFPEAHPYCLRHEHRRPARCHPLQNGKCRESAQHRHLRLARQTHPNLGSLRASGNAQKRRFRAAGDTERAALMDLRDALSQLPADSSAEKIQEVVYEVGRRPPFLDTSGKIKTKDGKPGVSLDWFNMLYQVLLGQEKGPRFGSFVAVYGLGNTIEMIDGALARNQERAMHGGVA